jgi:hypothetical protein
VPGEFASATAVVARGDIDPSGMTVFDCEVIDGWDIAGNANGGYLLAIAARAMEQVVGRPPLTVTAHYLSPGLPGHHTVTVEVVKIGRMIATATATMVSDTTGREVVRLLGAFGHGDPSAPSIIAGAPPQLPDFADCVVDRPGPDQPMPTIFARFSMRLDPACTGFREGRPTGTAEMQGWFEFADGSEIDRIALLLVVDAFPPPVFNSELPVLWVPTVGLTAHIRGVPAPGPLACVFRSRFIADGMFEEDGEVWDSAGRLVAQSRQLALTPLG